jgi:hypothetical protein
MTQTMYAYVKKMIQDSAWKGRGAGIGGRNDPNNVCIYEETNKNFKKEKK